MTFEPILKVCTVQWGTVLNCRNRRRPELAKAERVLKMDTQSQIQAAVEKTVIKATKVIEEQLDNEMERLDKMDADDLDKLRLVHRV